MSAHLLPLTRLTRLLLQNVGAAFGFYQDMAERRKLLRLLRDPKMGFLERGDGVWTWTFEQNELRNVVEAPSGSAVLIAGIMGLPFIRLRAALPDELLAGSVAQSLGRRDGLSIAGLVESREENIAVMTQLRNDMSCFTCGPSRHQIPAFFEDNDEKMGGKHPLASPDRQSLVRTSIASQPRHTSIAPRDRTRCTSIYDYDHALSAADLEEYTKRATPHEMVGTALMLAFLANRHVLPVTELSMRAASATEYFHGVRVPGVDHDFDSLLQKFKTMLGEEGGALTVRAKWMATTRLWRFLLLQRKDGGWDMTDSLAFALEAHEGQPPPKERNKRKGLAALATLCLCEGDLDDNLDDAADDAMDTDDEEPATDKKQLEAPRDSYHKRVKDCPISFSAAAMRHRIPAALLALNDTYDDPALLRLLLRRTSRVGSCVTHAPTSGHPKASHSDEPAAEPISEPIPDAECAAEPAAEGAAATAAADAGSQPTAAVASRAVSSTNDFGVCGTPVDGYGAQSPATTSVAEPIAEPCQLAAADALKVAAASTDKPRVPVERIWATLLSIKVLENMDVCWLIDDEAEEGEERTIVDAAREWLEAQGEADPRVAALLESGELAKAADKAIDLWRRVMVSNIAAVRRADVLNRFTALTHLQRATGRVIKSIMTDHGKAPEVSCAAFFSDACDAV